jgi:monovalent cation:H+ antiporter-2, CPA2 family
MAGDAMFFRDLAYVFVAAVLGATAAWATRQPLILGYVFGGILIGPFTPGPSVSDLHTFELFAEIGVVLLMFSIGVEFSLRDLLRVKGVAILGGPLGILLSIALGMGTAAVMGWPLLQGAIVGIVVSVASTMVLARLLMDSGQLRSRHGRIMIGITLVEDLAVVVLIVLIPTFGSVDAARLGAIARALGLAALILVPFFYLANKIVPPILTYVARTRSEELFLLVTLALALGTAAVTQAAGLSLALGAFLAGLLISESDYAHELLARVLGLRDVFVALFFVTVGALIDPGTVVRNFSLLAVIVALVVVGKLVTWTLVVWAFRHPLPTALLVGVGLTQIGEFSFILVQVARQADLVGEDVYNATLAAALITILINAALVRYAPGWIGAARLRIAGTAPEARAPQEETPAGVVVCGYGRVGSAVAEALETFETRYVAIETDPDIVKGLRARGITAIFGDASQHAVLAAAHAGEARLAVVVIPESDRAEVVVRQLRRMNATMAILARSDRAEAREGLMAAGATEVIQPELEAASTLIRHALRTLAVPRERALGYLERFRSAMDAAPAAAADEAPLPQVREITIAAGRLADQSLREARIRERFGVTVTAITRSTGEVLLHPSADTRFRRGDNVRLFGLPQQIAQLLEDVRAGGRG